MKRPQRTYTPELRAEVLALVKGGAPIKRIARERKIPEASIRWWRDHRENAAPAVVRLKAETDIASQVDQLRRLYLERARDAGAIKSTSGYYAVMAVERLTTVHSLLTGDATERVELVAYTRPDALRQVALRVIEEHREIEPGDVDGEVMEAAGD